MPLCLDLMDLAQGPACRAGVGLPCHSQQTANLWSRELWSCHTERSSLREGYKAAPGLQFAVARAQFGDVPSAHSQLQHLPAPSPRCQGRTRLVPAPCRGAKWKSGLHLCPLAHGAAPAQPEISEITNAAGIRAGREFPPTWVAFRSCQNTLLASSPAAFPWFSRIGACQEESA